MKTLLQGLSEEDKLAISEHTIGKKGVVLSKVAIDRLKKWDEAKSKLSEFYKGGSSPKQVWHNGDLVDLIGVEGLKGEDAYFYILTPNGEERVHHSQVTLDASLFLRK